MQEFVRVTEKTKSGKLRKSFINVHEIGGALIKEGTDTLALRYGLIYPDGSCQEFHDLEGPYSASQMVEFLRKEFVNERAKKKYENLAPSH